jgi:molybdate transport system substrate-binding protein
VTVSIYKAIIREADAMWKKTFLILLLVITGSSLVFLNGCEKKEKSLVVYAGKGLKMAVDDIQQAFEQKHDIKINVIYAGSYNLLATIQKTRKGDVFIPGSLNPVKMAGDLVANYKYVSSHIPTFAVRQDNPRAIQSYEDLSKPGVKIAVGNKDMCAVGTVADKIMGDSSKDVAFAQNVAITCSTVDELLDLVVQKEVDASLVWMDMLKWPEAGELKMIEIPRDINKIQEIHVAVLSTTADRKNADLFAEFVSTEGRRIFKEHGFGEK